MYRLKITKEHTIKSKEEAVAELQAAQGGATSAHDMFCAEHTQVLPRTPPPAPRPAPC